MYEESIKQALPAPKDITAPREQTVEGVDAGYFTSWVQQQVIERYGAPRAFDGGLRIKTTLDLELQRAAEHAVDAYLAYPGGPTASLVAIENSTGEVRAMVGGRNYDESPFNLATEGERQPGSSFKAFDLAAALEAGISPDSVWTSKQKVFIVPNTGGQEKFVVHNDEGNYTGSNTLTGATAFSDNSIYAEVGLKVGTKRIARLAHRMGITTPLSTNPAMTIGGLTVGVTPLDMAHAYETIAHDGRRVSGTLAEDGDAGGHPGSRSGRAAAARTERTGTATACRPSRVLPVEVAQTETSMLETVLQYGTGRAAAIGQFAAGKTGTTSNYGDAWFVGWDSKYTVAVWVGYPDKLVPMTTDFNGGPVLGGTYPALIWHDFMTSALQIDKTRAEQAAAAKSNSANGSGTSTHERPRSDLRRPTTGTTPGQGANRPAPQDERQALRAERLGQRRRRRGPGAQPRTLRRPADAGPRARARSAERSRRLRPPRPAAARLPRPPAGSSPGG